MTDPPLESENIDPLEQPSPYMDEYPENRNGNLRDGVTNDVATTTPDILANIDPLEPQSPYIDENPLNSNGNLRDGVTNDVATTTPDILANIDPLEPQSPYIEENRNENRTDEFTNDVAITIPEVPLEGKPTENAQSQGILYTKYIANIQNISIITRRSCITKSKKKYPGLILRWKSTQLYLCLCYPLDLTLITRQVILL
jgi:hypothetical protein